MTRSVPEPGRASDLPVLAATGLSTTFRGRRGRPAHAVDGVDLQLARGEVLALVGESGCGKTTLARTLLGLAKPSAGQVLVDGKPLRYNGKALKEFRRTVQMVLQDPTGSLNPRHTVYEAVAEGPRLHGLPGDEQERVASALSRVGLRPADRYFLRYPHELSGGQRQRVVIAGALALDPRVLIADEPVSSLDASVRGEILALLLQLRNDLDLSVLVVTHDLGLAWNIADRIAVMYLGRIVESGPTEQVLAAPAHPYTQALLSVVPETRHLAPVVLAGEPPDPTNVPTGCRFHPRCPALASGEAERAGVAARCRGESLPVLAAIGPHDASCFLFRSRQGMLTD